MISENGNLLKKLIKDGRPVSESSKENSKSIESEYLKNRLKISKFDVSEFGIDEEFDERITKEACRLSDERIEYEINKRVDLRDLKTFTIDGKNSKDLDDAISINKNFNGNYILGVHIADVSHYVREYSSIDKMARRRATSVYLNDRVIPMLPPEISNGICSLNQGEEKLTLSVLMEIDKNGRTVNHWICESVIASHLRTNYDDVSDIIENKDKKLIEQYKDFIQDFEEADKLAQILRDRRMKRGALSFDTPEKRVILDENRIPIDLITEERRAANIIIEEFMIVANETVAKHFVNEEIPFIYRILENPHRNKNKVPSTFITTYDLGLREIELDEITPLDIQRMINSVPDEGVEELLKCIVRKANRQARYSSSCTEHYTLATNCYCHFTSPIRRYPDLQIHRIIKDYLNGRMTEARRQHYGSFIEEVAEISTLKSRTADRAEREAENYYRKIYRAIQESYLMR